ncbi:grasp-with-spasm system ATP-grasp peptide maturase [Aureispira sp. CCB-QB1]|uniref:grasp-with-spasm system ATP-grasp peptide maturase n=1 Tax=Aureispira sp. CCB-QB1 TaxID=1313421 RepID=UPI000697DA99|nr:grasp-with-spasm system ATP-grasp peptide maturase [Aureispira sp. CCB-QB1]
MILILSKAESEYSTEDIMDWLEHYDAPYIRVNGEDVLENINYKDGSLSFKNFSLEQINVCWFRRSISENYFDETIVGIESNYDNKAEILKYLGREYKTLQQLFIKKLQSKKWLSHPKEANVNKLNVLEVAKEVGLNIPKTLVTTEKKELLEFISKVGDVISKPLGETSFFRDKKQIHSLKTCLITKESLKDIPNSFFPTLFQEQINKSFELRIFYMDNTFYPMAIFSQNDEKTKVDFRNYNLDRPNRKTPYLLEQDIENALHILVNKLGLTSGSLDLIKTLDNQYVFLEVNPIGQFGMTSSPCNYFLEEKIAQYLIQQNEERNL